MTTLDRVRVTWSGFIGGPGVSTFHFTSFSGHATHLQNLFGLLANYLPSDVRIVVPEEGEKIDSVTGMTIGNWTGPATAIVPGADASGYSAPSGAQIRWDTASFMGGRRLRGRTFLVPLGKSAYDDDGTLTSGFLSVANPAVSGQQIAMAPDLVIYKRPRASTPLWTDVHGKVHQAKPATLGAFSLVMGATVTDKSVVLRSRRD